MDDLQGYKNSIAVNKMKQAQYDKAKIERIPHYNSCLHYLSIILHYALLIALLIL